MVRTGIKVSFVSLYICRLFMDKKLGAWRRRERECVCGGNLEDVLSELSWSSNLPRVLFRLQAHYCLARAKKNDYVHRLETSTNVSKTYSRTSFCGTNVYGSQLACPLICFELTQMMRSKKHHSKVPAL
ncbi:hypothetical protein IEQ34_013456 [Dendrobium chrysotoxum]|uniref:Uncharacterized protein n=1 Tax=Dendrobium chrysotoxum TaxID=161865 RepID=A0AAV7GNM5_DENCH|nr:hypothetical protein IEQ34_013456 [Dendrobium chrysotoxum]